MTVPFSPEEYKASTSDHETRENIFRAVVAEFGIKRDILESGQRTRSIVRARQAAMYLMRKNTNMSYPRIGAVFGGKDHTTVMHAYSAVQENMKREPGYAASILKIDQLLPKNIKRAGRDVVTDVGDHFTKAGRDAFELVVPTAAVAAQ